MYQWCGFKSRRGKNTNLTALKSNSNTVWFNFQTYIYIYIYSQQLTANNDSIYKQCVLLRSAFGCSIVVNYVRRTRRIFRFVRTSTRNVSPSLQKCADRQRTQYKFNTIRVQPEDGDTCGLYFATSSNTDIGTLLWKITWMNSSLETQRRSRPKWKTFTNDFLCTTYSE